MPDAPATTPHWWDAVAGAFEAWRERQSEEVQEMDLLEQIELYAAECANG